MNLTGPINRGLSGKTGSIYILFYQCSWFKMENPFKEALRNIVKDIKKNRPDEEKIMQTWINIGQDYTKHARPASFKRGILYIDVEDSNWLYYCSLKKEEIKEKIKEAFSENVITDIKFKVGK